MGTKITFFALFWGAILFSGGPPVCWGDTFYSRYREGEALYQEKDYDQALTNFIDAQIESPEDARLKYNIANAHYKTKNYDEAIKSYLDVAATAQDISLEEKSYYNLGNCFYRQGKLSEAVEYYKKALDLDPEDQDAKFNLEFVREEIKRRMNEAKNRQEEQQGKKQPPEQFRDQEKSERSGGSEQKEHETGEDENNQGKDGSPESGEKQQTETEATGERKGDVPQHPEEEQTLAPGKKMSPEEAERWLKGLPDDQREILRKQLENQFPGEYSPEKDW